MRSDFADQYANRPGRPNANRPPAREPTAEEIAQVQSLGFSEFMAGHALRMANFNVQQAVEIMLTNEQGVMAYIEQSNQRKEQEKKRQEEQALK